MKIADALLAPGIFRLLLASVVVLHHTTPLHLGLWSVYVFFLLSGYWVSRMYREDYGRAPGGVLRFYTNRFLRLMPVFVTCVFLHLLVLLAIGKQSQAVVAAISSPSWIARNFLIIGSSWQPVFLFPIWSLDIEAQFYLCVPLLLLLASRLGRMLGPTVAGLALLAVWTAPLLHDHEHPSYLWDHLGFFVLGMYADRRGWNPPTRVGIASLAAFAVLCIGLLATSDLRSLLIGSRWTDAWVVYNPAFSAAGALLVAPYVFMTVHRPSSRIDRRLGDFSYSLYLFHVIPVEIYIVLCGALPLRERAPGLALTWFAIYGGAFLVDRLVDRPIQSSRKRRRTAELDAASDPT